MRLLCVVEGTNDIEFLKRVSRTLHQDNASLPDLAALERQGDLIFVPFGGGQVGMWTHRFSGLDLPEFHLYDRELPPETEYRQKAVDAVNQRQGCRAQLTQRRSLENYLHPQAILVAGDIHVAFGHDDHVAELTAQQVHARRTNVEPWDALSQRARNRMANKAKRWLNSKAADCMTVDLLNDCDSQGEVVSWLRIIAHLLLHD